MKVPGFDDFDRSHPQDVMRLLGDIVIIGEQIEHVNRIRVVSTGLEAPASDASVSGKVADACNRGVGGVTMTLSGGSAFTSREVTTSPDGAYVFPNVPLGRTYAVKPALENMAFNPESVGSETFSLSEAKTTLNFRADYKVLIITGTIEDKDGKGENEVSVSLTSADFTKDVKTNEAGVFRFEVPGSKVKLPAGTFKITPTSDKYTFDEAAKTWKCDERQVDFEAMPKPSPTPEASPTP